MKTLVADRGAAEPISLGAALIAGKKVAPDVTQLLMDDHRVVLGWFDWYEQSEDAATRTALVRKICAALRAHMTAEERWLYPVARAVARGGDLVSRAFDEHSEAKSLMAMIEQESNPAEHAKLVRALRDDIVAHVTEEELELFPALRATDLDLYAIGRSVAAERLQQLRKNLGKARGAAEVKEYPKMQIAQDQARELFVTGLKNAHATARNGLTMLESQLRRLEQYPWLKAKLAANHGEKRAQLGRLEVLLESHGASPSALKDAVMSTGAALAQIASAVADDEVIKNSFATLAHAKFEAAAYETLILFGEACGETPASLRPLQLSLSEERGLAAFIEGNLRATGIRFMQLRSEGRQASH
jgi:ferritin-like metal-binding protein YciE/hemerythrin superfamily protein